MSKSDLLKSTEAAEVLGVDRATFNRWVVRGDIPIEIQFPGYKGPRLFRRIDVERLAKDRTPATPVSHSRRVTDIAS